MTVPWRCAGCRLSGPVLRDIARLSQRYPSVARYGVFGVSTWPIGCDTPFSLFSAFAPWRACEVEVRYPPPPQKGYLSDTRAIPYKNKASGCDTPLCDTISKGHYATWGVSRTGLLRRQSVTVPSSQVSCECRSPRLRPPPLKKCPIPAFSYFDLVDVEEAWKGR